MCLSPAADFTAAAALTPVGVATLRCVRRRRELVLAALPLLFALHQFVEAFVWLGLRGEVSSGLQEAAIRIYLLFAQALLPVLVPFGVLLLEPQRARRRWMVALLALGTIVGLRLLWIVTAHRVGATALDHAITYDTDARFGGVVATGYVAATCGPALLSSRPRLRLFAIANIAGLAFAAAVRYSAVTSIWCLYAALVSGLILLHFRRERRPSAARAAC